MEGGTGRKPASQPSAPPPPPPRRRPDCVACSPCRRPMRKRAVWRAGGFTAGRTNNNQRRGARAYNSRPQPVAHLPPPGAIKPSKSPPPPPPPSLTFFVSLKRAEKKKQRKKRPLQHVYSFLSLMTVVVAAHERFPGQHPVLCLLEEAACSSESSTALLSPLTNCHLSSLVPPPEHVTYEK